MSHPTTPNPYELAARQRKAIAIAGVLSGIGVTHISAAQMTPREWELAAVAAHENKPSPITQQLVIDILRAGAAHPPEQAGPQ